MIKKLLAVTLLLWTLPHESSAAIKNEYLGEITVHVEGATRTKERYIEFLVEKCLKKENYKSWEAVDAGALGQCVSNSRLFKKVDVQVKRPAINVTIEERWTLIPIPNFYASEGKQSAGVFIVETNFLGYGKTMGIGGAVSTEGNTLSLFYRDPAVDFSNYTLRAMADWSSKELDLYRAQRSFTGTGGKRRDCSSLRGIRSRQPWNCPCC